MLSVHEVSAQRTTDLDHGRLHNIAGDTWATHVLLIDTDHHSTENGRAQPGRDLLGGPNRQALAIVLIDPENDPGPEDHWTITIDDTGTLGIPALNLDLTAEQRPASEAAALAQLLALATRTDDEHPTHAEGNQPWDEYADTTGALDTEPDSATDNAQPAPLSDAADGREGSVLPLPTHTYVATAAITEPDINALAPKVPEQTRSKTEQADPTLTRTSPTGATRTAAPRMSPSSGRSTCTPKARWTRNAPGGPGTSKWSPI